jgi:transposase-like protein
MANTRKQYTAEFKLKVVLESLQRETTIEEVRTKFGVATSMIHRWRQEFQAKAATIFVDKRDPKKIAQAQGYAPGESPDDLKKIIGELTVQIEMLKKVPGLLAH